MFDIRDHGGSFGGKLKKVELNKLYLKYDIIPLLTMNSMGTILGIKYSKNYIYLITTTGVGCIDISGNTPTLKFFTNLSAFWGHYVVYLIFFEVKDDDSFIIAVNNNNGGGTLFLKGDPRGVTSYKHYNGSSNYFMNFARLNDNLLIGTPYDTTTNVVVLDTDTLTITRGTTNFSIWGTRIFYNDFCYCFYGSTIRKYSIKLNIDGKTVSENLISTINIGSSVYGPVSIPNQYAVVNESFYYLLGAFMYIYDFTTEKLKKVKLGFTSNDNLFTIVDGLIIFNSDSSICLANAMNIGVLGTIPTSNERHYLLGTKDKKFLINMSSVSNINYYMEVR